MCHVSSIDTLDQLTHIPSIGFYPPAFAHWRTMQQHACCKVALQASYSNPAAGRKARASSSSARQNMPMNNHSELKDIANLNDVEFFFLRISMTWS
jgi:hypothetical protein